MFTYKPKSTISTSFTSKLFARILFGRATDDHTGSHGARSASGQDTLALPASLRAEDFIQVIKIQDVPFSIEVLPVVKVSKSYCDKTSLSINSCYTLCW
jgi:hypothetical protein